MQEQPEQCLVGAVQSNFVEATKLLIKHSKIADINGLFRFKNPSVVVDYFLCSAFIFAARKGHRELLEYLVTLPAVADRVNFFDQYPHCHGWNALHYAVDEGHREAVGVLLRTPRIAHDFREQIRLRNALHIAAGRGFHEIVGDLLETKEFDINAFDKRGMSAWHFAVESGNLDTVKLLMTVPDIELDSVDLIGFNVLHHAAEKGHSETLKYLLSVPILGVNSLCFGRFSPLHYATRNGDIACVKALLSAAHEEVDINARGGDEKMIPLMFASKGSRCFELLVGAQHRDIVKLLVAHAKIDLNAADYLGVTALHRVVMRGDRELVELLLSKATIDVNVRDRLACTPLQCAIQQEYDAIISLLKSVPGVDIPPADGATE